MLKSLEISGFKSFAKKTELQFKSKVTAIVGPNGSGKSNVAEAFRFVLGEQSIKSMRGKRGEDLIWNGSNETPRANRASVKITFDNSRNGGKNIFSLNTKTDDKNGTDLFDEVVIERIVNRDGNNEYLINGSQVRLKDVIELLAQAHIGSSGHHIISQGEADKVLTANPKERKEMIEDALGLKIYQYKKEESQKKLQKTRENIDQVESLRREIAPHIRFLKKQVEKVEKAEELRKKLAKFYREYLKREKIYLDDQRNKIDEELKPIKGRLEILEQEMEEAKKILENSSKKDEKSQELLLIEEKIRKTREEKDVLGRQIGKIEGEIYSNQKIIDKIQFQIRSDDKKTILLKEIENLETEVSQLSDVPSILSALREFINRHKENDTVNQKEIDELSNVNENLLNQKTELENKISDFAQKLSEFDLQYREIKQKIEDEKDTGRDAEKNIFRISSEQSEIRAKANILEEREKRLKIEEEDWKREIQEGGILLGIAIVGFENEILEGDNELREKQEERRRELEKMKIRLEDLSGGENLEALKEFKEVTERDEYLSKELEDLKTSAGSLEELIKELAEKLDVEFKQGIEKINKIFNEFFSLMFGGGEAKLIVVKEKIKNKVGEDFDIDEISSSLEDFEGKKGAASAVAPAVQTQIEEELDISVSLPRKRIRGLEMLSGGERALTSIALLFAISQVNPPPFIILDETDAALDEANSKKYGDMIESLSKVSQLIIITHNRETMSRAGIIYGVTMGRDSVSRLLSIAFDEAVAVAK